MYISHAIKTSASDKPGGKRSHKFKCFKTCLILTFRCVSQPHQSVENFYDKWYMLHANEISYKITNDVKLNYRLKL